MFDKFKRIIPKISEKFRAKEKVEKIDQEETDILPVTEFKYLSNDVAYRNATILEKLWYLRMKLDWFDDVLMSNNVTADSMSEMLCEIIEELDRLAYSRKNMQDVLGILNIKHDVLGYNMQYRGELNHDADYLHVQVDEKSSIYEQIWCLRYMFDCACVADSNEIHADVCGWLKSLLASVSGRDADAIKKFLKEVKDEKFKCFFRNLRY